MTQKAGPMRVISVMRSLVMKQGLLICAEAWRVFATTKLDGEFRLRRLVRASALREDRPRGDGDIFPDRVRNREERPWKTTKTCQGLRGHGGHSLPRENLFHKQANLSCAGMSREVPAVEQAAAHAGIRCRRFFSERKRGPGVWRSRRAGQYDSGERR